MLGKAVFDHARGAGWFADPRGKPSFFQYARGLCQFILDAIFLRTKPATEEAYAAAKNSPTRGSGDGVTVQLMDDYLEFQPPEGTGAANGDSALVGVIIFPGAFVSPFAYSILARTLAQRGYPCFVLRLPFDLAFYGWTTAGRIIKRPQREDSPVPPTKWVLVGHSLGTTGVELFTEARPECVSGVVFMGSSSGIAGKLENFDLPCLVIRGSRDAFTPEKDMLKTMDKLPKDTETCVVDGGNHSGFGSYSHQLLDWEATITPEEQRRAVVEALTDFIERNVVL
ncbi:unnamed protein product [Laminaria digitata]